MNDLTIARVEQEFNDLAPQIALLLPPDVSADKFRSVCLAAIRNNADLLRCEPRSLFNACLNAAQDGLMPDGREGAIVPRKGKAVWQPMIQGIYKRVKSSGSVAALSANVVYDGETFEVLLGDEDRIIHRRDMALVQRGKEVATYAIATLKDGTKEREVMTWEQVDAVRQSSAMPNSGPWTQWTDEMARKTVVRRLAKRLPVIEPADEMLHRTINRVDSLYDFGATPPERPTIDNDDKPAGKTAAARVAPAPKVSDTTVYEPPKRKIGDLLDAMELALGDAQSPREADAILRGETARKLEEHAKGAALERLNAIKAKAAERFPAPAQPMSEDDPDWPGGDLEIINGDKLAAG